MQRNGIRRGCYALLMLLVWFAPASADETANEITEMLSWWDEYGSYWDDANELIEFAGVEPLYRLAENTVENSE